MSELSADDKVELRAPSYKLDRNVIIHLESSVCSEIVIKREQKFNARNVADELITIEISCMHSFLGNNNATIQHPYNHNFSDEIIA